MAEKLYGINWAGSKNSIAEEILHVLPPARVFVDLFCGGCAMTHAALASGKFEQVIANDVKPTAQFFKDALLGKIEHVFADVSREEFFERIGRGDVLAMSAWSFGGCCERYLFSREEEDIRRAVFRALTADDAETRADNLRKAASEFEKKNRDKSAEEILKANCRCFEKPASFTNARRIFALRNFPELAEKLVCSRRDYTAVDIPPDAVVYADIPYFGTLNYGEKPFDFERFYAWAEAAPFPIFVSEYTAPDSIFACVWERRKAVRFGRANVSAFKYKPERLFVQKRFAAQFDARELSFDFGDAPAA